MNYSICIKKREELVSEAKSIVARELAKAGDAIHCFSDKRLLTILRSFHFLFHTDKVLNYFKVFRASMTENGSYQLLCLPCHRKLEDGRKHGSSR